MNGLDPLLRALLGPGATAAQALDWESTTRRAIEAGLAFLLHQRLGRLGLERDVPASARRALTASVREQIVRNLLLNRQLTDILSACHRAGLRCVPLRGPALAEELYGDPTARPMGDLDLLVEKNRLAELSALLVQLGFRQVEHRPDFARRFSYTLSFMKEEQTRVVIVEPRWTLAYPPFAEALDMTSVWDRCRRRKVLGVDAWRLATEDLLLHLCLHLVHAGRSAPLLWWVDLDRLIRKHGPGIRWHDVVDRAERSDQYALLAAVLQRLRAECDTPIPETFGHRSGGTSRSLLGRGIADLLAGRSTSSGREEFAFLYAMRGLRPRLTYVAALLFPTAEYMSRHYGVRGRWRLFFCYLVRGLKISREASRWGGELVRHLLQLTREGNPAAR